MILLPSPEDDMRRVKDFTELVGGAKGVVPQGAKVMVKKAVAGVDCTKGSAYRVGWCF